MRYHKIAVFVLSVVLLALAGCGGSNSGNPGDPLAGGQTGTGNGPRTPSAGRIMFTSAAGTDPGTQTNLLTPASKEVDPAISPAWEFMQLIPFKLTDAAGNSRAGAPVTRDPDQITLFNSPSLEGR